MKKLSKADIFKIRPAHTIETIELEDYPGIVFGVKVMNAGEQEDYENTLFDLVEKEDGTGLKTVPLRKDSKAKLLLRTVCDPNTGELIFDESDLKKIREMPGKAVRALFDKAREVNDVDKKETSTEELEKN
jgi:hypothetical protein